MAEWGILTVVSGPGASSGRVGGREGQGRGKGKRRGMAVDAWRFFLFPLGVDPWGGWGDT